MTIGVIGVGGVARYAHIPSYKRFGLEIVAVGDIDAELAKEVGAEIGAVAYQTVAELLADPAVSVVDIATPPGTHVHLVEQAAAAGKAVLIQKPLCSRREDLRQLLRLRDQGARVRLNMTGSFVSAWERVGMLLANEAVGRPFLCTINNRDWWDREPGRWEMDLDGFIVHEMMIHHLDLCLRWFGVPWQVTARGGVHPAQRIAKPNFAGALLHYADGLVVQILEDWTLSEFGFSQGHPFEEILISGDRGCVRASSERVEWAELGGLSRAWQLPAPGQTLPGDNLSYGWFPDSFGRAMSDFLGVLNDFDVAAADWRHLEQLTELSLTVAEALETSRWLEVSKVGAAIPA